MLIFRVYSLKFVRNLHVNCHRAFTSSEIRNIRLIQPKFQNTYRLPFESNTQVTKDTVLFKYENATFFKLLVIFGGAQLFFWLYLARFCYRNLRDAPEEKSLVGSKPFWRRINLGENKFRYGITFLCITVGYMFALVAGFLPLRTIHTIILCRGGMKVKIQTYTPIANLRTIEVPLTHVSCQHSRHTATSDLSLKIRGKWLFFLLDRKGVFLQPKLFDNTVGLYRTLK